MTTDEDASRMTYRDAATRLLTDRGPMHYRDLADAIVQAGLVRPTGNTPEASLNATITVDINQKGKDSRFIRIRPGVFGLRELHEPDARVVLTPTTNGDSEEADVANDDANQRARILLFPIYSELRHLLCVWSGRPRRDVTSLHTTINGLSGTPSENVDWTNPDDWIPARLEGSNRALADAIWKNSGSAVNPRYTQGHWQLAQTYGLLCEDGDGVLQLTKTGQNFQEKLGEDKDNVAEAAIDEAEGLIKLLSIVADNGPAPPRELIKEWGDYLSRRSSFGTDSTIKETMSRRLKNLTERDLVKRKGTLYSTTQDGLTYLQETGDEDSVGGGDHHEAWALVRQQEKMTRESLHELLHDMDPFDFEYLIKRLLEEMNYQNVDVTPQSHDGGVDVVGDIELGITSVREVVQVKRHRSAIQRHVIDALRGSLHRFNANRGTIITTSRFTSGARADALAQHASPITLIDGDKLIDLLIEHAIGVRKRPIELLEVDATVFAGVKKGTVGT